MELVLDLSKYFALELKSSVHIWVLLMIEQSKPISHILQSKGITGAWNKRGPNQTLLGASLSFLHEMSPIWMGRPLS